jgi:lysine 2,3-aminomutase
VSIPDWKAELRGRIRGMIGLEGLVEEIERRGLLPFAATPYYLSLADPLAASRVGRGGGYACGYGDPILAQALPDPRELERAPRDAEDPLGEALHLVRPRLVRQYPSRALLRATGDCPVFCRHCFRRNLLPEERGFMSLEEMDAAAAYIASEPEIREVLVSGGDPLSAEDGRLEELFSRLRASRPGIFLRICTRSPVTLPQRITADLVSLLRRFKPLKLVFQANHPVELSPACAAAIEALVDGGIPLRVQTVLLRRVNDEARILESLFASLAALGADPYYLFQGDLAAGTRHFRVPLSRGLAMYGELKRRLSGLELPRYAVDAPGGGGKVFLPEGIVGRKEGQWILAAPDGTERPYPEEDVEAECG